MDNLFLVRHGLYNGCGVNGGLTEEGMEEGQIAAETIDELLLGCESSILYSPSKRTTQMAQIISDRLRSGELLLVDDLWTGPNSLEGCVRPTSDEYYSLFSEIVDSRSGRNESLVLVGHYELLVHLPYRFAEENGFSSDLDVRVPEAGEVIHFDFSEKTVDRYIPF